VLQSEVSSFSPLQDPTAQLRFLERLPPPQVLEQVVHSPQADQRPDKVHC
jgi:hypothetical protein